VVARVALPDGRRVLGASVPMLRADDGMVRLALPPIPGRGTLSFAVRLEPTAAAQSSRASRTPMAPRRTPQRKAPWWQFWKRLPARSSS
jgi:hypothetical protein